MNKLCSATVLALLVTASAFAQTASLSAPATSLMAEGGDVTITATASYEGQPGALGWSIVLPENWTLVRVTGPHPPAVVPEAGTKSTLEFVYVAVPANRAEFSVVVRYPAGERAAKASATVFVRSAGVLKTLSPESVSFQLK